MKSKALVESTTTWFNLPCYYFFACSFSSPYFFKINKLTYETLRKFGFLKMNSRVGWYVVYTGPRFNLSTARQKQGTVGVVEHVGLQRRQGNLQQCSTSLVYTAKTGQKTKQNKKNIKKVSSRDVLVQFSACLKDYQWRKSCNSEGSMGWDKWINPLQIRSHTSPGGGGAPL